MAPRKVRSEADPVEEGQDTRGQAPKVRPLGPIVDGSFEERAISD